MISDIYNDNLYEMYQKSLSFDDREDREEDKECVNCGGKGKDLLFDSYCNQYCRDAYLDYINTQ